MLTQSADHYLKAIYMLLEQGKQATTSLLAKELGIKPASVTNMLQKLSRQDPPLLNYRPHKSVTFSSEGERVALQVIRYHRMLEYFLHEKLGFPLEKVHDEADRIDHVISEELGERLAEFLGQPEYDCHGDPIPSKHLVMPASDFTPLTMIKPGESCVIRRIGNDDSEFLKYLTSHNLLPGSRVKVLNVEPFEGPVSLELGNGSTKIIGFKTAGELLVDRIDA